MRRLLSLRPLSRRGINTAFVYLLLILISIFSGLVVRFMAGSLISEHIEKTLGLRLLLHGIGLAYNSMYSLPVGESDFRSTYPDRCSLKCVDCNATMVWLPFPKWEVFCNCSNGISECINPDEVAEGATCKTLLNYPPDTKKVVCDDYIVDSVKPVMLFKGSNPVSMAVMANLYIYPDSSLFWGFNDFLSRYTLSKTLQGVHFFDRKITVFSEMPLNLNDYGGVRALLRGKTVINWGDDYFVLHRVSVDNYDSIYPDFFIHGLEGLANKVYLFNKSKDTLRKVYLVLAPFQKLNVSGKEVCEYNDYFAHSLNIDPHLRWDKVSCFNFSVFGDIRFNLCNKGECEGNTSININELTFSDIFTGSENKHDPHSDIVLSNFKTHYFMSEYYTNTSSVHPEGYNCSLSEDYDYCVYTNDNGENVVAMGNCSESGHLVPLSFKDLFPRDTKFVEKTDGLTPTQNCILDGISYNPTKDACNVKIYSCGRILFYEGDTRLGRMPDFYQKNSPAKDCDYCTYINGNEKITLTGPCEDEEEGEEESGSCYNYSATTSDFKEWPLSKDCLLTARCDNKGFDIIVSDNPNINITTCNGEVFNDICKISKRFLIKKFSGCSSKGEYHYSYNDVSMLLRIKDFPETTLLASLLTSNEQHMIYDISVIKPADESYASACKKGNLVIKLEPASELETHSKKVTDDYGLGVEDRKFTLSLEKVNGRIEVDIK